MKINYIILDLVHPKMKKVLKFIDKNYCPTCELFERYTLNQRTDKTDGRVNRRKCTNNCTIYLCGSDRCPQMYLIDNTWKENENKNTLVKKN